jgi:hypothetical protein
MSIHIAPPAAVDLLAHAVERVRSDLVQAGTLKQRARIFWAGVAASRDLGASDVVRDEFIVLAIDSGLFDQLSEKPPYAAAATIDHLIHWGFLDRDPFGKSND